MRLSNLALVMLSVSAVPCLGCGAAPDMTTAAQAGSAAPSTAASSTTSRTSPASSSTGMTSTASGAMRGTSTAPTTAAAGSMSSATAKAGTGAPAATTGSGGQTAAAAGTGGGSAAHAGSGGSAAAAGAGGSSSGSSGAGAVASGGGSNITGTLGALGAVKPVMAGWATTNGLETLIYLSSAPLTCEMMMTKGTKWLSKLPAGSQVLEIVVGQPSAVKSYTIGMPAALGGGEVNYAEGSKSSSTEVTGKAGKVTLTTAKASGVHEGMIEVTAPYMASGSFHAEWCEGGTEY